MECEYAIKANYCLVEGSCHIGGSLHKEDKCKECNPVVDSASFVAVDCGDGKVCDSDEGCVSANLACNGDDAICVTEEQCMVGTCAANGFCEYTVDAGGTCDDGDACTDGDVCDDSGNCAGTDTCGCDTAADCPAGNGCQEAVCDDSECSLVDAADDTDCDDGDACTETDICTAGQCAGTAMTAPVP